LEYFAKIWDILRTFGIFYEHLEYFTKIWNILRKFGIFYDHLVHFLLMWYIMYQEKSGNPAEKDLSSKLGGRSYKFVTALIFGQNFTKGLEGPNLKRFL
jgi:hypothetical protein